MVSQEVTIEQIDRNRELYEKYSQLIERELNKRKHKWHLTAISYMDFDDVKQIIKVHVSKKIHLYNEEKAVFINWLNTLISNQILNLLRNHYGSFSKVCNKCYAEDGENKCLIYGDQCSKCPAYYNWELSKKNAYNVKLTLSTENHINEISNLPQKQFDIEKNIPVFHNKIFSVLNESELSVYKLIYVQHKSETYTASVLLKKPAVSVTQKDLKSIENIKDRILVKAKEVIYSDDFDLI